MAETDKISNNEPSGAPELPDATRQKASEPSSPAVAATDNEPSENTTKRSDDNDDSSEKVDTTLGSASSSDKTEHDNPKTPTSSQGGRLKRFFRGYWRHKWWTLPLTILVIIAILLAVPFTRYHILGLFLNRDYQITVVDSNNSKPVSGATIVVDNKQKIMTDASGQVEFNASVGHHNISISKNYYREYLGQIFVGIATSQDNNNEKLRLTATGRQVPIKVINKISGQPISDATIKVLDTTSKTDKSGQTTIVLPVGTPKLSAIVSAKNYNDLKTDVYVTASVDKSNTFSLTPAGKAYFLSNASGSYDVDSANLDGSDRQTVLAGTGHEDSQSTALFMSPDGRYGVLVADRVGAANDQIYALNTATGKISTIDNSDSVFSVVGWSGDYFVYEAYRQDKSNWQSGATVLKSYDATKGTATTLVANKATGSGSDDYAYQSIENAIIMQGRVYYDINWTTSYSMNAVKNAGNSIDSIKISGGQPTVLQKLGPATANYLYIQAAQPSPSNIIYDVVSNSGETYYSCSNNNVSQDNTLTKSDFDRNYPTFYTSPDSQRTFWSETRDGKNVLFVGDASGQAAQQISALSDYQPYGWYGNDYLLVSHNNALYVMPAAGLSKDQEPVKIGTYFANPARYQY